MVDKIPVSEKDLSSFVEDCLDTFHWQWMHPRPGRVMRGGKETYETPYTGKKGFLDYLCLRGERIVVFELKSEKGKVSAEQQEWLDAWSAIPHCELYLWRPSDFQVICSILR